MTRRTHIKSSRYVLPPSDWAGRHPHVVMDVSRLLARRHRSTPTGIDRVEHVYAAHLISHYAGPVSFLCTFRGQAFVVPIASMTALVRWLDRTWQSAPADLTPLADALDWPALREVSSHEPEADPGRSPGLQLLRAPMMPVAWFAARLGPSETRVYLNVSHHRLDRLSLLTRIKAQLGGRAVFYLHDAIPLSFPEYVRPGEAERHARRLATVDRLADRVLVNSAATAREVAPHLPSLAREHVSVVPLWAETAFRAPRQALTPPGRPYFLCLGTIEARKNHTLLLSVWRDLVARRGERAPRLVLVGRRGWENDTALAFLDRCPALRHHVIEADPLSDASLAVLLQHARALLMPSFAEGFGLPVVEALAVGTPVIAADIPALREVGRDVPTYLSPLDGLGWRDAIHAFCGADAPGRQDQIDRMQGMRFQTRNAHLETAFRIISSEGCPQADRRRTVSRSAA